MEDLSKQNEEINTDVIDSTAEDNEQANEEESNAFGEAFDDKPEAEAAPETEEEQELDTEDKGKDKKKDPETEEPEVEDKEKAPTALELAEKRAKELEDGELEAKPEDKADKTEKPDKKDDEPEDKADDKPKKAPASSPFRDVIAQADEGQQKVLKKALKDFPELEGVFDVIFGKLVQNAVKPEDEGKITPEAELKKEPEDEKQAEKVTAPETDNSELEQSRFMLSLVEKMPEAVQIANDEKFHDWLDKQSVGIQKLAGSANVDDALMVLNAYKESNAAEKAKAIDEGSNREKKNSLHKTTLKSAVPKAKDKAKDDFSSGFDADDDED